MMIERRLIDTPACHDVVGAKKDMGVIYILFFGKYEEK
jgi:hypothetical protein